MSMTRQFMALSPWIRALIVFVVMWGMLLFVFASKLNVHSPNDSGTTVKRLNQAIEYLEQSKHKNDELRQLIDDLLR